MCTNYTPSSRDRLRAARLGLDHLPPQDWPAEVFPGFEAPIVVRAGAPGDTARGARCERARFGLVPHWAADAAQARDLSRHTLNARSETAAIKPSFRSPWRQRHFALVPMEAFFEPCWEDAAAHGGRSVRWRMAAADGELLTAAALWDRWTDPASGEIVTSFSLLTVNADGHAVMGRMHRPGDEKRMPVFIPEADRFAWLHASADDAHHWMRALAATQLTAAPAPLPPRPTRAPRATARPAAPAPAPSVPDTPDLFGP